MSATISENTEHEPPAATPAPLKESAIINIESIRRNAKRTTQGRVYSQLPSASPILDESSPCPDIEEEIFSYPVDREIMSGDRKHRMAEILLLKNVFTEEEARALIDVSETIGYDSLENIYPSDYRNNDRIMVDDKQLTDIWFQRMLPSITKFVERVEENRRTEDERDGYEYQSYGKLIGLNNRLRICRYQKGGIFQQHYDAAVSFHDVSTNSVSQSKFTVMAYLNDIPEEDGGATRFYKHDGIIPMMKIQPRRGHVVIFPHKLLHDGELCSAEKKYIIRSDLMFVNNTSDHE